MKSIKITLFVTAAILFSMILGTLKAQAAGSACSKGSAELECEIQYYQENKIVLACLQQELKMYPQANSVDQNIQSLMSAIVKAEVFENQSRKSLSSAQCQTHQIDAEMALKGSGPSAADELEKN